MNIRKIVFISFLMIYSPLVAHLKLTLVKCNDRVLSADPIVLDGKEKKTRTIGNLRIDVTSAEDQTISLQLSYKDEKGNFVTFYSTTALQVKNGDEIQISSPEGFSLVIKATELE